jgi:5'-nucleotidase (lipoprotein e(P4) family)
MRLQVNGMNTNKYIWALALIIIASLTACAGKSPTKQTESGILWVDTAAEYDALTLQAYQNATRVLDDLIANKQWTALPGQSGMEELPTAIILDVDETALSNVEFQLQLEGSFSHAKFDEWQNSNPAGRMPGAPEFIQAARDKGVTMFFITNRPCKELDFLPGTCPQEAITLTDLAEAGIKTDSDHLMLVGEQAEWSREKSVRQNLVGESHRVIMLIGDDLGDFLPCIRAKPVEPCPAATAEDRARITLQHREYWGLGWHILQNPMHGSWTNFVTKRIYR